MRSETRAKKEVRMTLKTYFDIAIISHDQRASFSFINVMNIIGKGLMHDIYKLHAIQFKETYEELK